MGVCIREASLVDDESAIVALVRAHLFAGMDQRRFQWLYRDGPYGAARAWLAFDGKTQEPVGMAALFPRRAVIGGNWAMGCVLGDFCVSEKYRSLGPALQLQRACLSAIASGDFAFCYDFPSTVMVGVYKHLGLAPTHKCVRMVKILRTSDKIRRLIPEGKASRAVAKVADLALALRDSAPSDPPGVEYRLEEQACTPEYSRLANRIGSSLGSCVLRSSQYLNWRYRQHPSAKHEILAAYRDRELLAYCAFTMAERQASVVDLFGVGDDATVLGLLNRLIRLLRSRGAAAIGVAILAHDPRRRALRKMGFWPRESIPVIAWNTNRTNLDPQLLLMHGDRES
jgi:hypothetical protein